MKRASLFGVLTILVLAALTLGTALATDGNLPGGTSISVDITAPSDGTLIAYPPGDVTLEGSASVGVGLPVADTGFVYLTDASGSTASPSGGDCGPDQNPMDPQSVEDEIIDCEIAAVINLNEAAIAEGTVGEAAMTIFAGAPVTADATPAGGDDPIIAPGADANANTVNDVDEVMHSIAVAEYVGEDGRFNEFSIKPIPDLALTDFAEAASEACSVAASMGSSTRIVVMLSDGHNNAGADINTVLPCDPVIFHTFAVGGLSSCTGDPAGLGSLQEIADLTGGTCTHVTDPSNLPAVVPGVIASQLLSLSLSVDGGAAIDISGGATPSLPQTGPALVTYEHTVAGLVPGIHELCVTATGSNGGGTGSVTECIEVTVADIDLAPPTETNELGTPDQTHTVTATVAAGADGGVPGRSVDFEVLSGPNAGNSDSDTTDGSGEAEFTYTALQGLGGLGTDVIEACFTDDLDHEVCDTAEKTWVDTTPPEVACLETVNPHGKKVPPAGSTTPPGPKGGQNEDGFYELTAWDAVDPEPQIYVVDTGSGTVFGPFASGTKIKYTEDPTATPTSKKMGSSKGQAGAIDWHIIGNGDAAVFAVDFSGNQADPVACLVPPPPK